MDTRRPQSGYFHTSYGKQYVSGRWEKGQMAGNRPRSRQFGQEIVPEALRDTKIPKIGMTAPETN